MGEFAFTFVMEWDSYGGKGISRGLVIEIVSNAG